MSLGTRRPTLAVLTALWVAACQSDAPLTAPAGDADSPTITPPALSILDGANGGSDAIWYLPPLVPSPDGNPDYEPENYNAELDVEFRIYACGAMCPDDASGAPDVSGDAKATDTHYQFLWRTPRNGSGVYRAFTLAEGVTVGFIDVELTRSMTASDDDVVAVRPGTPANYKVLIEEVPALPGVGCTVDSTQCQAVVPGTPTQPVIIQFEDDDAGDMNGAGNTEPDLVLSIPAGTQFVDTSGQPVGNVAFTLENCAQGDDLQADLLLVGPCYTILTFVNGVQTDLDLVGGAATVSICDLNDVDGILANPPAFASHEQEELVSIIHFDNGDFYEALEHTAPVGCSTPIPSVAPRRSGVVGLARSVVDGVFGWLSPREAVANAAMIDRGGGGRTGSFRSNFRAALPSKIVVDASYPSDPNGDPLPGSAIVGGAVTPNPAILVIDANGEPVQGATVNFEIQPTIESTVNGSTTAAVTTNASGVADVSWVLATTNPQSLKAFARGMTAKTNPVIQPPPDNNDGVLDNVVLGNATFCQTNECASNDIIAESITFDATAVVLNLIGSSSRGGGGAGTGGLGTNPGSLFAIDPATGQATLIGSTDVNDCTGVPSMSDVDYQPGTGTIYGIIGSALRGGVLVTVDPATGAATVVGTLVGAGFDVSCGAGGGSDALAFTPDGRLFAGGWAGGFAGGSLLEIDPATGAVIATVQTFDQVNVGDNGHLAGLATDPQGQLWASRGGSNLGTIHTVDITSGITSTLQLVDSQGAAEFVHVSDIAFAADGTLYASLSRENMLATIDTQTGLLTRIGSYGAVVTRMSGLAALP